MIADVWSKRDFFAAGAVLVGVVLVALGELFDSSRLTTAGAAVVLVAMAVLIAWRIIGGPGRPHDHDEWV